jgi:hypothetical protein
MKSLAKNKKNNIKHQKKAVTRVMKARKEEMDEACMPFLRSFVSSLVQEAGEVEAKAPEDFTADQNKQDFEGSLDAETPKDQYDVAGTNPNVTANAITEIQKWSQKLDEFAAFMNDPQQHSLHQILATEDRPGSILRGITRKASDSITRIAGEIAKLKETLNGFINMAPKKQRDSAQQVANPF